MLAHVLGAELALLLLVIVARMAGLPGLLLIVVIVILRPVRLLPCLLFLIAARLGLRRLCLAALLILLTGLLLAGPVGVVVSHIVHLMSYFTAPMHPETDSPMLRSGNASSL